MGEIAKFDAVISEVLTSRGTNLYNLSIIAFLQQKPLRINDYYKIRLTLY